MDRAISMIFAVWPTFMKSTPGHVLLYRQLVILEGGGGGPENAPGFVTTQMTPMDSR